VLLVSSLRCLFYWDDTANITVTEMRSQARRLQAEQGGEMGLILLDYLQLMEGSGDIQELSKNYALAQSLAHVSPLRSISPESGSRSPHQYAQSMSDLRESGS